jgi:outer membrane protein OmpA-like peptidoglycan-associated protein
MSAYSQGAEKVGPELIKECAEELRITIGLDAPPDKPLAPAAPGTPPAKRPAPAAPIPPPSPRRARSAWVFIICLLAFGMAWYIWQDAISEYLARLGRPPERAALEPAAAGAPAEKKFSLPPLASEPAKDPAAAKAAGGGAEAAAAEKAGAAEKTPPADPRAPVPAAAPTLAPVPAPAPPPAAASQAAAPPQPTAPPQPVAAVSALPREFVVYFTQNSSEVPIYAFEILGRAAALLKEQPLAEARIEGHSDALGNPFLNQVISEARANAVKSQLIKNGIAASRLTVFYFGSDRPIDSNETAEGRSKNRRVVVRVAAPPPG